MLRKSERKFKGIDKKTERIQHHFILLTGIVVFVVLPIILKEF